MAHISQESCLLFTCHFRHPPGRLQFFLYLLQTRNISHGQQHLFISVLHHICPRNTHHTIHVVISVIRQIKPHRSFQPGKAVFFAKTPFDGSTHRTGFTILVSAACTGIQRIFAPKQFPHPVKDAVILFTVQTIIIGFLYQKITIGQYNVRIDIA